MKAIVYGEVLCGSTDWVKEVFSEIHNVCRAPKRPTWGDVPQESCAAASVPAPNSDKLEPAAHSPKLTKSRSPLDTNKSSPEQYEAKRRVPCHGPRARVLHGALRPEPCQAGFVSGFFSVPAPAVLRLRTHLVRQMKRRSTQHVVVTMKLVIFTDLRRAGAC